MLNCGEDNDILWDWREENLKLLVGVFSRKDFNGEPVLLDKAYDKDRTPLISYLHEIACGELDPRITDEMRSEILCSLIEDIFFPYRYKQGDKGTCAPITIYRYFFYRYPGEAFRLAAGLLKKEGRIAMRNGDSLIRDTKISQQYSSSLFVAENFTRRLFEEALMEYANGQNRDYDYEKDRHIDHNIGKAKDWLMSAIGCNSGRIKTGLWSQAEIRALEALCGEPFVECSSRTGYSKDDLLKILERAPFLSLVSVRWRKATKAEKKEFGYNYIYHAMGSGGIAKDCEGFILYNSHKHSLPDGSPLGEQGGPFRWVHKSQLGSELWGKAVLWDRINSVLLPKSSFYRLLK